MFKICSIVCVCLIFFLGQGGCGVGWCNLVFEVALRGRTTARPPLVDRHGLCSRHLWLTIVGKNFWRILQSGKDLARTWRGLGIFTWFETAWGRFEGSVGILEALRGILKAFWKQLKLFLQPCWAKMAPRGSRKVKILLNIENFVILGALGGYIL